MRETLFSARLETFSAVSQTMAPKRLPFYLYIYIHILFRNESSSHAGIFLLLFILRSSFAFFFWEGKKEKSHHQLIS